MANSPQLLTQPAFAEQWKTPSYPLGVSLTKQKGYIVWNDKGGFLGYQGGAYGDGRDLINFQFNPATVASSFAVNNASLQAAMMYPVPGSSNTLLAPLQQVAQFDLYFDRTFEVNWGTVTNAPNDPAVIGVQADVLQFMQFTGMLANTSTSGALNALGSNQSGATDATGVSVNSGNVSTALTGTGVMMMIPAWVFFGNSSLTTQATTGNYSVAANAQQIQYYGYISSWSVNYTHWSATMIPMKCMISVSFTMLPTPTKANVNLALDTRQGVGAWNPAPNGPNSNTNPIAGR